MYEFFFSFFAERMYEFTVYKMRSIVDIRLNFDYWNLKLLWFYILLPASAFRILNVIEQ